jgi:hypothetical protein
MEIKKAKILEAIDDELFDIGISADELKRRKLTIARILEQAEKAVNKAEETGQHDIANKLKDRIELLQELFDRAEEFDDIEDVDDTDEPKSDKSDDSIDDGEDGSTEDSDSDASDGSGDSENDSSEGSTKDSSEDEETSDDSDSDRGADNDSSDEATKDGDADKDLSSDKGKGPTGDPADNLDNDKDTGSDGDGDDRKDGGSDGDQNSDLSPDPSVDSNDGKSGDTSTDRGESGESTEDSDGDTSEDSDEDADKSKESRADSAGSEEDSEEFSDDGGAEAGDEDSDGDSNDDSGDDGDGKTPPDGKIKIDPFSKRDDDGDGFDPGEREVETVFDAAKRILSKLSGESKRGAVSGLKDLLKNRGLDVVENINISTSTKLQEKLTKTLAKMSEDEFDSEISKTLDLIDKVLKIDYSHDLDKRIKEIKRDTTSRVSRAELEKEDAEHVKADRHAIKALDRENDNYGKIKGLRGLEAFEASLYKAVADQVEQAEEDEESWAALDRRHDDDPTIIKKGHIIDDGDTDIPSVYVYFDQSGSWTDSDIEVGMQAISTINEFHQNGQIKLQILYMAGTSVYKTAAEARRHGYAEGWHAALQHIKGSNAKNVVILSDSDLDHPLLDRYNRPTGTNGRTVVDGCVWWLWKDGYTAPKAMKELIGYSGNFEYRFSS